MFFQRKKKRLLRELWRSRLAKPPSLPPPQLSDYYGPPCSARVPATPAFWTADDESPGVRFCHAAEQYEDLMTTTKEPCQPPPQQRRRSGGRGAFCLMGHCCGDAQSTCSSGSVDGNQIYADEEAEEKAFLSFLGKTLAQRQLETLLEGANASRTGQPPASACVLIRRQEAVNWSEDPHVIACRMWRWTDLDMRTDALKRTPSCPNGRDPVYICCNPSHWFRVLQPELPPPPYSATVEHPSAQITTDYGRRLNSPTMLMDLQREADEQEEGLKNRSSSGPDDMDELPEYSSGGGTPNRRRPQIRQRNYGAQVDDSSTMMMMPPESSWSTHGQDRSANNGWWCSLAYWEQSTRVGAVTRVDRATVNVVAGNAASDEVCLSSLAGMQKLAANSTRGKIGAGVTISREGDSMWLYNRSTAPVFVHSLTICDVDSYLGNSSLILKLLPGHCMRAYNPRARMDRYRMMAEEMSLGPVDVHSVRISFQKGWGQTYKRQDIKSCPCWLEVILNQCHFNSDERFAVDS